MSAGSSDWKYQCPICHVVYDAREDANDHVKKHPGVKPSAVVTI